MLIEIERAPRNYRLCAAPFLWREILVPLGIATTALPVCAGGTIAVGPDQSLSIGMGLRTAFTSAENGAPDGKSRSEDFSLESIRLYVNAQLNNYIKATFNTEKKSDDSVEVIDGIAKFEPLDEFNIWFGRLLPPSDRANLDGPYYLLTWDLPDLVSQYPSYVAGRDNGALAWGSIDKRVVYSLGAFDGHNNAIDASSESGHLLYAGRVAVNIFDPELSPAYYTASTYFGAENILSIGLATQYQADGVGAATDKGNYLGYNADILFETKDVGSGSLTLESAIYRYNTDGKMDIAFSGISIDGSSGVGGLMQGNAFLLSAGYLLPLDIGPGKFQPYMRYQEFSRDKINQMGSVVLYEGTFQRYDVGVNYVIAGSNAKISACYTQDKTDDHTPGNTNKNLSRFVIGVQLQL